MFFKKISRGLVWGVQKTLLAVFLTLIYFLGIGITRLLAALCGRPLVYGDRRDGNSSWRQAEGYEPDPGESLRQS